MVEAELGLGRLERILDRPAAALDADQGLDRRSRGAPGGEEGQLPVADGTPHEQAARPQVGIAAGAAHLVGREVGEFQVGPVMEPRPLGARAGRQAPPSGGR